MLYAMPVILGKMNSYALYIAIYQKLNPSCYCSDAAYYFISLQKSSFDSFLGHFVTAFIVREVRKDDDLVQCEEVMYHLELVCFYFCIHEYQCNVITSLYQGQPSASTCHSTLLSFLYNDVILFHY